MAFPPSTPWLVESRHTLAAQQPRSRSRVLLAGTLRHCCIAKGLQNGER